MVEKITNIFGYVLSATICVVAFLIFVVALILFLPFILVAKVFESLRPRSTLWL